MKILFQGDSVTDFHRLSCPAYGLGEGYPRDVVAYLSGNYPELNLEFVNRGISGNRTCDLVGRWDEDCINIKPHICTILIGVNDTWRRYDENDPTSLETFEKNYINILEKCKSNNIKCVLLEPFVLFSIPDREIWLKEDLCFKQAKVKELAQKYDCEFVPLQSVFFEALKRADASYWIPDGVHPSVPGHALICKELLKVFGIK